MAEAKISAPNKSVIIGLLEVRKHRGLSGDSAIRTWVVSALECLLQAELNRIEKKELNWTDEMAATSREQGAKFIASLIRDYGADSPFVQAQLKKALGEKI